MLNRHLQGYAEPVRHAELHCEEGVLLRSAWSTSFTVSVLISLAASLASLALFAALRRAPAAPDPRALTAEVTACSSDCSQPRCLDGNPSNGGVPLIQGSCQNICSRKYGGFRYCGTGSSYAGSDAVQCQMCGRPHRGLMVVPTQGSSNNGAFLPGVYSYAYSPRSFAKVSSMGFTSVRLPINVETAGNATMLQKIKEFLDAFGGTGIIVMFDDSANDVHGDGHGDGKVTDAAQMEAMSQAWLRIHSVFRTYPDVLYEVFNEPFGYTSTTAYLSDMKRLMAGLPPHKCILDGLGYADNILAVADAGWDGALGWHVYPMWLPDGQRTQERFSNLIQHRLNGVSQRTYITEFGAVLNKDNHNYESYIASGYDGNVNCLRGLHDAVVAFRNKGAAIRGAYVMHGLHNGDAYDIWDCANTNGRSKVVDILQDFAHGGELKQRVFPLEPIRTCEKNCTLSGGCKIGDDSNGGEPLDAKGHCGFRCSKAIGTTRYCGTGSAYSSSASIDCLGCACPARCNFLPCFSDALVFE
mmetsp:Transcript_63413/g.196485  ORF Transcript_63413/g.196485 Transcript_63413/m.196485 type:complete len:526 (+) Transcript_63413:118-1695(+)